MAGAAGEVAGGERRPPATHAAGAAAPPVGAQLRARRVESGMSLRALARRLDVSPSLVSQIETGKIQPSVRTLYAIVSELGLSLDETLKLPVAVAAPPPGAARQPRAAAEPPVAAAVTRAAEERSVIELESGVRWERLAAWAGPDAEFMITVYGVGGSSSADGRLMRHSGREFGLVLSGSLAVTVGFEDHLLEPGDSITFESTTPHRLRNDGDIEARAIWVTIGRHAAVGRA